MGLHKRSGQVLGGVLAECEGVGNAECEGVGSRCFLGFKEEEWLPGGNFDKVRLILLSSSLSVLFSFLTISSVFDMSLKLFSYLVSWSQKRHILISPFSLKIIKSLMREIPHWHLKQIVGAMLVFFLPALF